VRVFLISIWVSFDFNRSELAIKRNMNEPVPSHKKITFDV